MNSSTSKLELSKLSNFDLIELQNDFMAADVLVEVVRPDDFASTDPNRYGVIGTATLILLLTPMALQVLSQWLAKRHDGKRFEEEVTVVRDGVRMTHKIRYEESKSEPPSAAILKELHTGLAIDPETLKALDTL